MGGHRQPRGVDTWPEPGPAPWAERGPAPWVGCVAAIDAEAGAGVEAGAVTAEFAATLPAVMLVLAVIISLGAVLGTQVRVSDAARAGARALAITADQSHARAVVSRVAGGQPQVEFHQDATWATVTVRQSVRVGPVPLGPVTVSAFATAWLEP